MKAHELAKQLLAGPDVEVRFDHANKLYSMQVTDAHKAAWKVFCRQIMGEETEVTFDINDVGFIDLEMWSAHEGENNSQTYDLYELFNSDDEYEANQGEGDLWYLVLVSSITPRPISVFWPVED